MLQQLMLSEQECSSFARGMSGEFPLNHLHKVHCLLVNYIELSEPVVARQLLFFLGGITQTRGGRSSTLNQGCQVSLSVFKNPGQLGHFPIWCLKMLYLLFSFIDIERKTKIFNLQWYETETETMSSASRLDCINQSLLFAHVQKYFLQFTLFFWKPMSVFLSNYGCLLKRQNYFLFYGS